MMTRFNDDDSFYIHSIVSDQIIAPLTCCCRHNPKEGSTLTKTLSSWYRNGFFSPSVSLYCWLDNGPV
jgi:hypothetical protein